LSGNVEALADALLARDAGAGRLVLAVAGPPGAGKSTLAQALTDALERARPGIAALVPMDGFHLDNAVLEARGLLARKGAPATFDLAGYRAALTRIRAGEEEVAVPTFDRGLDLARAVVVGLGHRIVVTEGNYLLLDRAPWLGLAPLFDRTLFLSVPEDVLRERLIQRWLDQGLSPEGALARAEANDLPNARLVMRSSRPADDVWI
jgi:pantothenate kinase